MVFTMNSVHLILVLLILVVKTPDLTSADNANNSRQAYIALLYGDTYALPVRVMMRSLYINSPDVRAGIRDRIILVTGDTSTSVKQQIQSDGVIVHEVSQLQSPYIHDTSFHKRFGLVLTKLMLFNMTKYSRVVLLDADLLVLRDLSSVFECGEFCATFINPCYFNSGFVVITPNETLFHDMVQQLPTTPSYDGGDQGFLNAYFSQMINAPLFDPETGEDDVASRVPVPPPFARLKFDWHADHSAFFSSFAFTFSRSSRCASPRSVEWLGPPIAKPWLWWTYAVLDLSWTWHTYRRQLSDPYPTRLHTHRNAAIVIFICQLAFIATINLFFRHPISAIITSILPRLCPIYSDDVVISGFAPTLTGILLWVIGFVLSVKTVPKILSPGIAIIVFVHVRIIITLWLLIFTGVVLCFGQREKGHSRPRVVTPPVTEEIRLLFLKMLTWTVFDALYLVVWSGIIWKIQFATMWSKGLVVGGILSSQALLVFVMVGNNCLSWACTGESITAAAHD